MWDYLSTLGRADRGALVLGFHAGLDADAAAALLGLTAAEVTERTDAALEDLGGLLHLPRSGHRGAAPRDARGPCRGDAAWCR